MSCRWVYSFVFHAVLCCLLPCPYPTGGRSAIYPFIVSLSFIESSKLLSKYRTFFRSIIIILNIYRTIYRKFQYDIQHERRHFLYSTTRETFRLTSESRFLRTSVKRAEVSVYDVYITQLAKLSFKHPSVVLTGDVLHICY